jgi:hypothetical protein
MDNFARLQTPPHVTKLSEEFNKMDPKSGDSNGSVGSNTDMKGMLPQNG